MVEEVSEQELEALIKKSFERVKNEYCRPAIGGPDILKDDLLSIMSGKKSTALFNFLTRRIGVSPSFVRELGEFEDLETICNGLNTHEFGHYFFTPRELSMQLYLSYKAEKEFKEFARSVYCIFSDFENDNLILDNGFMAEDLKKTREASYKSAKGEPNPANAALYLAYNNTMGTNSEVDLSEFDDETKSQIEHAVKELSGMTITSAQDLGLQWSQLYKLGTAILPLLKKSSENNSRGGQEGTGECSSSCEGDGQPMQSMGPDSGGSHMITKDDVDKLSVGERQNVEDAIKELIRKTPKGTYQDIKKHFLGEEQEKEKGNSGIGFGESETSLANRDTIDYYKDAAKQFGIYIRPRRQLCMSQVEVNFGKKDWKPTDSPLGLDVRFSGGKILPGLTKSTRKEKIPYPATKETVPNLIIYKDASGSMNDPSTTKDYASIAGAIFIMSYLRSGANVRLALFDSNTDEMFSSRKEDELISLLCGYKGGGTDLDVEKMKHDLEQRVSGLPFDLGMDIEEMKRNPFFKKYLRKNAQIKGTEKLGNVQTDLVIITDGGIGNLNEVVSFLKEKKEIRPTIIHTGNFSLGLAGYDGKTNGVYEGITVFKADCNEDIIKYARKATKTNLLAKYEV